MHTWPLQDSIHANLPPANQLATLLPPLHRSLKLAPAMVGARTGLRWGALLAQVLLLLLLVFAADLGGAHSPAACNLFKALRTAVTVVHSRTRTQVLAQLVGCGACMGYQALLEASTRTPIWCCRQIFRRVVNGIHRMRTAHLGLRLWTLSLVFGIFCPRILPECDDPRAMPQHATSHHASR